MEVGDQITIDGMSGTIVAIIEEGKFAPGYPAGEWAYLASGLLVKTVDAGLVYFPASPQKNSN